MIFAIVENTVISSTLPNDTNALYLVVSSADCTERSFCTEACGWHNYQLPGNLKYSWVGNPEYFCPSACSAQSVSRDGNLGVDAMVSVIAYEATEAVSDPSLNAWLDSDGEEKVDKCTWTFGNVMQASHGADYNILLNGLNYLVQQN
ncbi:unnamed protein product [Rotaria sp. Silwood2]|nr:unnamed protein product [Rotaria sp. Silwood2]CAF3149090.1 unnamed protein product [Rotaria sp. Silwood2]CAF3366953.1 unnamed protein product [Rotaria sp. Silwood2]CAF4204214.1 unnamed protein product [Rotaria sp. Silwood2]CAF4380993.1 unnamed protein product [Rotaria sp. Silwood2]